MTKQYSEIVKGWNFDNSYARLSQKLYTPVNPVPVKEAGLILFNTALAAELGLEYNGTVESVPADIFSGNSIPPGSSPLAQAYAGHQFGHLTMLGDGRAILLGEHINPQNQRFDIQLKGSGQTPYSRRGDGRATLYSMLREYLIGEAVYHLGIPTTRSLAVVKTGEAVIRETEYRGAVLTRVAASHIRIGTFEFLRYAEPDLLRDFAAYTIERHFPELSQTANPALALLEEVIKRQVDLVTQWMRVGFIHGVMNTDNMSIAGETIDYGPCAFMNVYNPRTVFSSIDNQGRYSFGNQPSIAQWNLGCLAIALLPLIHENEERATLMAREKIETFDTLFKNRYFSMMCDKLGIETPKHEDGILVEELLNWMESKQADYTNTFLAIEHHAKGITSGFPDDVYKDEAFVNWLNKWELRVTKNHGDQDAALKRMQKNNPAVIPRNHHVEEALETGAQKNDMTLLHELLAILSDPYSRNPIPQKYQSPPQNGDKGYQTFCGT